MSLACSWLPSACAGAHH